MNCNRSCCYCFAKEKLDAYSNSNTTKYITIENFDKVQKFLQKSNCMTLQLAGGEPTIHPQFEQILLSLIKNGFIVNILSNGLWKPELNEQFTQISTLALGFLLNIERPSTYSLSEWSKIENNLTALRSRNNVTLSFNIFETEPDYSYIFNLTSKYDIKSLRLSFSMPVVFGGKKNSYLDIAEYKNSTKHVMDFVEKAESQGIKTTLDNTVPICMFNAEQLTDLIIKQVIDPTRNFVCKPALDIGPDLSVWRCFGTSKFFNRSLDDFNTIQEVYDYFQRASRLYQFRFYPYDECKKCEYAKKEFCQGGCIGFAAEKCGQLGYPTNELIDEELLKTKLKLSSKLSLHEYSLPEKSWMVHFDDGQEMVISKSMVDLLSYFKGNISVSEVIREITGSSEELQKTDETDNLIIQLVAKQLLPIIRLMVNEEVLIT